MPDQADQQNGPSHVDVDQIGFEIHDRQGDHTGPQQPVRDHDHPVVAHITNAEALSGGEKGVKVHHEDEHRRQFDKRVLQ